MPGIRLASGPRSRSHPPPFPPYNRSHMQTDFHSAIPDASLAVFPVNGENSHQGFAGRNPAPHPVREACKFTVLLGLRGQAELNRIGSRSTGKERDAESGLDYFGARYYGSSMGRWMSPDWSAKQEPVPYSKLDNPQTLNLYSYVQNNPLSNLDDDGHATIEVKYNPLALGSNHSFIVITDRDGTQTVFRAGPSVSAGTGWITPATGGSASQSSTPTSSQSDSSNSSSPGAGPTANGNPYGQLVSQQESPTDPNGDNMSTISGHVTVLSNDLPASSYINGLQQFDSGLNSANIPYNPLSTNSNAYVTNALQSIGVQTPKAPVWAPGAGTNLHVTPAPPAPPPPGPPPCSVAGACSTPH
jgi:RHS repeat-associated protein